MKRIVVEVDAEGRATLASDFDSPNTLLLLQKLVQQGITVTPVDLASTPARVEHATAVPPVPDRLRHLNGGGR